VAATARIPGFAQALDVLLDDNGRAGSPITRRWRTCMTARMNICRPGTFGLYERNWRFGRPRQACRARARPDRTAGATLRGRRIHCLISANRIIRESAIRDMRKRLEKTEVSGGRRINRDR